MLRGGIVGAGRVGEVVAHRRVGSEESKCQDQ